MTNIEYQEKIVTLNDTQRVAFDTVVQYTRAQHQYFMDERDALPEPLHLFVTGGAGAGTGKSHVIGIMKKHIE